jgi:hypothetical protein
MIILICPLSAPFLLTKPGERMIMYLCARDIDVSSFYTFSIVSPGLVNRKGAERGQIDISNTQIHDHSLSWLGQERKIMYLCSRDIDVSSFYAFSIDQARRENGHVFVF